jgi:type II secretory pathway pseudopilin PulG
MKVRRSGGFTSIELLVVIAIIAILIGLLLPAVQKVREDVNKANSQSNLLLIHLATREYQKAAGSYPSSAGALLGFCGQSPQSCRFDLQLLSKPAGGYRYAIVGPGVVEAEPEYAGITGSETLAIDASGRIAVTPTPGADSGRRQLVLSLLGKGTQAIASLSAQDPRTLLKFRESTEAATTAAGIAGVLDADGNGAVTAAEIFDYDTNPERPLGEFLAYAKQTMKLGDAEIRALPAPREFQEGVKVYSWVRDLTAAQITDPRSAAYLGSLLSSAEAAERAGDTKGESRYLKMYLAEIDLVSGKLLPRSQAEVLKTLVNTL